MPAVSIAARIAIPVGGAIAVPRTRCPRAVSRIDVEARCSRRGRRHVAGAHGDLRPGRGIGHAYGSRIDFHSRGRPV